jgi:hypothetical protein
MRKDLERRLPLGWWLCEQPCDRCDQPRGPNAWDVPHLGVFCSADCALEANAGIKPYLLPEDEARWPVRSDA